MIDELIGGGDWLVRGNGVDDVVVERKSRGMGLHLLRRRVEEEEEEVVVEVVNRGLDRVGKTLSGGGGSGG